ncbi:hypothetical protein V3C99_007032 [Haemonchus contortus]
MDYVRLITIIFHTICDSLGMLFNMALLYLVLFRTPSSMAVYSILIGNAALTDFIACLAAVLIQQRIVPLKTSVVYFSHGPCQAIGAEFCFLIYSVALSCYVHALYSMLFSFYFRYYILKKQQPSPRLLKCIIAIISLPSCFQLIIMCFANQPATILIPILEQELPQYEIENETISGHANVFQWETFTVILHVTLPLVPVYVCILILRKRIITMLSTGCMSENTKILHKQLLKALTCQAMLPGLFFFGALSYACGTSDEHTNTTFTHWNIVLQG